VRLAGNLLWILAAGLSLPAQDLKDIEKKVSEFSLPNGLHFIVMERHDAPVASFHTYVNAGSMNDPAGESGLAHLLERTAFTGTQSIGTRNWNEEKKALDAIEEAYDRMEAESNKGVKADQSRVDMLRTQVKLAAENARRGLVAGEYLRIFQENGSAEPTARTSPASTEFSFTLPSNRSELWFLMESQRLLHPAFREFYLEREASGEEYRQRYEASPQPKVLLELLATAFRVYPYRNPPTGWPSDLMNLRRSDAQAFFDRNYLPSNITVAICGDVDLPEIKRMAERYFGPMAAKGPVAPLRAEEPVQIGPRTAIVESPGQPVLAVAYKRPNQFDRDDVVFDVIQLMLGQGRSALLTSELIEEKHVAVRAQAIATFPDGKGPSLFAFLLTPAPGRTVEENRQALEDLLQRFKTAPIDLVALERAKAVGRAGLLRLLGSNSNMAALLASHHANYGDWRKLFTNLDDLNRVTADQVSRVANLYFVATGRTTAYSVPPGQSDPPRPAPKPQTPRQTGQGQ
jgi:predicted Zn-dependent peptidase